MAAVSDLEQRIVTEIIEGVAMTTEREKLEQKLVGQILQDAKGKLDERDAINTAVNGDLSELRSKKSRGLLIQVQEDELAKLGRQLRKRPPGQRRRRRLGRENPLLTTPPTPSTPV
jgi:hypothetical protein